MVKATCNNCKKEFEAKNLLFRYCPECKAIGFGGTRKKKGKSLSHEEHMAKIDVTEEQLAQDESSIPYSEDYASQVNVADPQDQQAQGIAERILRGIGIDTTQNIASEKNGARRQRKEKFFRSIVPLVSNLSVLMVRTRLHGDYKACAPLEKEVIAVLNPLAGILDRRIEFSASMSEDTEDILAMMYATGKMTIRIWDTKNQIDEKIHAAKDRGSQPPLRTTSTGGVVHDMPIYETGQFSHNVSNTAEYNTSVHTGQNGHQSNGTGAHPGTGELVTADGHQAAGIIQAALARDYEYRSRNGML